jgi:prophage tail gpP-like protein
MPDVHGSYTGDKQNPPVNANTEIGSLDDIVRVYINGSLTKYVKYDVTYGIMSQPSVFSITLGSGDVAKDLLKKITPRSVAELYVGPTRVQFGIIEDITGGAGNGATEITFAGRDWMTPLTKKYVHNEKSFGVPTYYELTRQILDICGLADRPLDGNNDAARRKFSRSVVVQATPAMDLVENIPTNALVASGTKVSYQRVVAKIGQTWFDFLKSQYKQCGLYLWATADGGFVLARPTAKQRPLYALRHGRDLSRTVCNITSLPYQNRTSQRHSSCVVMGRVGSGQKGRGQIVGEWGDYEMQSYGYSDEIVIHDNDCKTVAACEYLAKRTLAEERRANCSINVVVSGHTTPSLLDPGKMVVWTPDTVVSLRSDEYGINDDFYIEEVTFHRGPQTTTSLRLMRKLDLIYLGESNKDEAKHDQDATRNARAVDLAIGSSAAGLSLSHTTEQIVGEQTQRQQYGLPGGIQGT